MSKMTQLATDLGLIDGQPAVNLSDLQKQRVKSNEPLVFDSVTKTFVRKSEVGQSSTSIQPTNSDSILKFSHAQLASKQDPYGGINMGLDKPKYTPNQQTGWASSNKRAYNHRKRDATSLEDLAKYLQPVEDSTKEEYYPPAMREKDTESYNAKYVPERKQSRFSSQSHATPTTSYNHQEQSNSGPTEYGDYERDYKAAGYESAEAYKAAWDQYYKDQAAYEAYMKQKELLERQAGAYQPEIKQENTQMVANTSKPKKSQKYKNIKFKSGYHSSGSSAFSAHSDSSSSLSSSSDEEIRQHRITRKRVKRKTRIKIKSKTTTQTKVSSFTYTNPDFYHHGMKKDSRAEKQENSWREQADMFGDSVERGVPKQDFQW